MTWRLHLLVELDDAVGRGPNFGFSVHKRVTR
jgi:hypothetical protein